MRPTGSRDHVGGRKVQHVLYVRNDGPHKHDGLSCWTAPLRQEPILGPEPVREHSSHIQHLWLSLVQCDSRGVGHEFAVLHTGTQRRAVFLLQNVGHQS